MHQSLCSERLLLNALREGPSSSSALVRCAHSPPHRPIEWSTRRSARRVRWHVKEWRGPFEQTATGGRCLPQPTRGCRRLERRYGRRLPCHPMHPPKTSRPGSLRRHPPSRAKGKATSTRRMRSRRQQGARGRARRAVSTRNSMPYGPMAMRSLGEQAATSRQSDAFATLYAGRCW